MKAAMLARGLLLAALGAGCGQGDPSALTISDPPEASPLNGMDVESVRLDSDGTRVRILVRFKDDVLSTLKALGMGVCGAELNLDLDSDEKTGGVAWEEPRMGGFEIQLRVLAGVQYASGARMAEGGLKGREVSEGFASYRILRCKTGESVSDAKKRHATERSVEEQTAEAEAHDRASRVTGRELALDVPYASLGIRSGQKIRVLARETGAAGRAEDVFLPPGTLVAR